MVRGQSEALAPMIDAVMTDAGCAMADLDAVAVTRGPGAFTGLRIGLSAARALALSIGRPCLGISTFDVLAAQARALMDVAHTAKPLVIAIETKRDDVYLAAFNEEGAPISSPMASEPEIFFNGLPTADRYPIAGDAAARVIERLSAEWPLDHVAGVESPDPTMIAALAEHVYPKPETAPPTPIYLRPPDVTMAPKKS